MTEADKLNNGTSTRLREELRQLRRRVAELEQAEVKWVRAEQLLWALNEVAISVRRVLALEEVFTAVAEELKKVGCACVILVTDESQERLPVFQAANFSTPIEAADAPIREVVREKKTVFVELKKASCSGSFALAERFARRTARTLKTILAPLIVEDKVIDVLLVQSEGLSEKDTPTITAFAYQTAIAWCKARLMQDLKRSLTERRCSAEELRRSSEKLQRSLDETVPALASAAEMRDSYTAGHQRRVADLACAIARDMGLSNEKVKGILMSGLIHDIGKINLPAEILSQPSPLSSIELDLIKTHPKIGHEILKEKEFPWPVAQIVLQHHERMNGSGYPHGLKGDDILLEARIIGVADVVEAMSSYRSYRPALDIDKVMEKISKNERTLYDPDVVAACLRVCTEKSWLKSLPSQKTSRSP